MELERRPRHRGAWPAEEDLMCDRSDDHQDPPAGVEEPDGSDPPLLPEERRLTPLDAIRIGERFRKDLGNIEALAESIEEVGLINPVVLAPDGTLLAGQRRLEAVRLLGWESIDCRVVDPGEATLVARLIEHDENVFRKDFTVEERVRLYLFVPLVPDPWDVLRSHRIWPGTGPLFIAGRMV